MAFYVPAYLIGYGSQNFLWLSSIVLILAFLATVFESRFLASMAAVGGLVTESLWVLDFLFTVVALVIGSSVTGFTDYIFAPDLSTWLKVIALYHLALPPLLIWLILRLGYDSRAWIVQLLLSWIVVLVIWFFTNPSRNINFVFSYVKYEHLKMGAIPFLILVFVTVFVLISGTHLFLRALSKRYSRCH